MILFTVDANHNLAWNSIVSLIPHFIGGTDYQVNYLHTGHYVAYAYQHPVVLDYDGDGDRDVVSRFPTIAGDAQNPDVDQSRPRIVVSENRSESRFLLTKITDGFGKVTTVQYDEGVNDGTYQKGSACTHPTKCLSNSLIDWFGPTPSPHRQVRTQIPKFPPTL